MFKSHSRKILPPWPSRKNEGLKILPDCCAHPVVIRPVCGRDRHRIALGNLRRRPVPVLRMTVGKREIGSLTMPIRGHVPPLIGVAVIRRGHSKMHVQHRIFILINED